MYRHRLIGRGVGALKPNVSIGRRLHRQLMLYCESRWLNDYNNTEYLIEFGAQLITKLSNSGLGGASTTSLRLGGCERLLYLLLSLVAATAVSACVHHCI